uniref:Helicase ATP-binding domain-containing protein n=1 Tax=viral metagenome TaxID=1070528 RepID=A0A6C0HPX2_9ZZZZ
MDTAEPTYIGIHGYTIKKECLEQGGLKLIKNDLNVRPYIPSSPIQSPSFPVYTETEHNIHVPRFYGIEHYGLPDVINVPRGTDIKLKFEGSLRDYQTDIVKEYIKNTSTTHGGGGLLEIPCGEGKTVIALKILSELNKKTLVIVHKTFLGNQWIERINQFLPGARIGKLQGQINDIEDKDIVIGMLQSLSMKEYAEDEFKSFGLIIVDECHHISSEVFSRSLTKIITFYTLGLSATMQRKDGLSKVFKMFLGDIVFSKQRDKTDTVLIKAIDYIANDSEFNKVIMDQRGNPAYSSMISKLCSFGPRSEFIISVIITELKNDPLQQIIVLAHNRNVLEYIHDAIEHRKIATVGYYLGGMKEADLKSSELDKVIIATYAMAAEALDIKTLTTLLLVTPKTDVVQAVGRILRVKHARPMVVDIIDTHDLFKSQWAKRKKYYKSNNYKIMHTNSRDYVLNKWNEIVDTPKKNKCLIDVSSIKI